MRFLKLAALGFLLSLPWIGTASAQSVNNYWCNSATIPCPFSAWTPVSAANPFPVTGSFSATTTGFPTIQSTGTPISVTTGGATGTLPTGAVVVASNVGATNGAYCKLGASATTSDQLIPPNSWFAFTVGANTQLTCITSTSTTTVNMVGGSGLPTGSGGGGGGGSGSSGAVFGPTAGGSAAANPPVQIGGVQSNSNTGVVQPWVINSSGNGLVDIPSGSAFYNLVNSATPAGSNNIGGVEVIDASGTNKLNVVAASTAPVTATNTAAVVALRPDSPGIIALGPATVANSVPTIAAPYQYTPLTPGQYSVAITTSTALTVPTGSLFAVVCAAGNSVNYTYDGTTTPTSSVGLPLASGQCIQFSGATVLANLKFIQTAATATLNVGYTK